MWITRIAAGSIAASRGFLGDRLGSLTLDLGLDDVDERRDDDTADLGDFVEYLRTAGLGRPLGGMMATRANKVA